VKPENRIGEPVSVEARKIAEAFVARPRFGDDIDDDLDILANAYLALDKQVRELREALEAVNQRFNAYTHADVRDQFVGVVSEGLAIIAEALANNPAPEQTDA